MKSLPEITNQVKKNLIWKSIFRRDYRNTVRDRAQAVFGNVFLHLHPVQVRESAVKLRFTWGMGGITFFAYILLIITGVVLMFYYHPSIDQAYTDIKDLEYQVPFGVILRNLHRWGAHFMVIVVMIHMFRVFMTGSYKAPRQFNWGVGVILLVLTFLLSFTGYLTPWDQLGFWAITVGTNMGAATPLLGYQGPFSEFLHITPFNDVRFALLGGALVGGNALLRSYIWHCVAIPLVATILMLVHFWRVRKDGGISKPQK
ncbi:MAG: cytochrome b N-terminal domain-containing protein [Chlorobium sp.]|jgi:quinol-cytochrome oxidoreductase complex cytochrome b subunit